MKMRTLAVAMTLAVSSTAFADSSMTNVRSIDITTNTAGNILSNTQVGNVNFAAAAQLASQIDVSATGGNGTGLGGGGAADLAPISVGDAIVTNQSEADADAAAAAAAAGLGGGAAAAADAAAGDAGSLMDVSDLREINMAASSVYGNVAVEGAVIALRADVDIDDVQTASRGGEIDQSTEVDVDVDIEDVAVNTGDTFLGGIEQN